MLRKTNYIQRKLDEKRLARHMYTYIHTQKIQREVVICLNGFITMEL